MAIKVFWVKTVKTIIEIVSIVYFVVGAFVFLGSLMLLLWAVIPSTSIKAGSYMIASFVAIGTALIGFIGAYTENFCLVMAYGILMVVTFAMRTISALVLLKIRAIPYETEIPAIMHGLPGTSLVYMELIYAIIEILLAISAFYMCWSINKRQNLQYLDPQYYYTMPDYQAIHSNSSLI